VSELAIGFLAGLGACLLAGYLATGCVLGVCDFREGRRQRHHRAACAIVFVLVALFWAPILGLWLFERRRRLSRG
jgi:hypothetical protein